MTREGNKMRFIHTSDWHLGKSIGEISLIDDQRYFLLELCKYISENNIDALLISGDIYHRSVPPTEAVVLLDEILDRLINQIKVKVMIISGNHDSQERIEFGSNFYKNTGLYVEGIIKKKISKVSLEDEFGEINFFLLPYLEPPKVRYMLQDNSIKSFNDAYESILNLEENKVDTDSRNIILAHGFFSGIGSQQEIDYIADAYENNVGGADMADIHLFDKFDYAAFGHIHKPMKVSRESARYSGSILKYSLSEANYNKNIVLVDLKEKNNISIQEVVIKPKRDLYVVNGYLSELLDRKDQVEDYVFAELKDEIIFDAMSKLRVVYPNAIGLSLSSVLNTNTSQDLKSDLENLSRVKNKNTSEMFSDFYQFITGEDISDKRKEIIDEVSECAKESEFV